MIILLLILATMFVAILVLRLYKRLQEIRKRRINENEYTAAVTLWNYARLVKDQIDEVLTARTGVLDFTRITVPHIPGYRVLFELAGYDFKVHAIPERYNRSGQLSLYIDKTLTVRAADRFGKRATGEDEEYTGGDHS